MPIVYVGGQAGGRAGSTSATTVTFNLTGGVATKPAAGDLVIIGTVVGTQGRNPATEITGYTQYRLVKETATTYDTVFAVAGKWMGTTPDTNVVIPSTGNNADAQCWVIHVFRGVDSDYYPTGDKGLISVIPSQGTGTGRPAFDWPLDSTVSRAGREHVVLAIGGAASATGAVFTASGDFTTNFKTATAADTNDATVGGGYSTAWDGVSSYQIPTFSGGSTASTSSWCSAAFILYGEPEATTHNTTSTETASAAEQHDASVTNPNSRGVTEGASAADSSTSLKLGLAPQRIYFFGNANTQAVLDINTETSVSGIAVTPGKPQGKGWDAVTGSKTHGYLMGGGQGGGTSRSDYVSKMLFSSEAFLDNAYNLSRIRGECAAHSSSTKAYCSGGYQETTVDAITYSSDVCAQISATMVDRQQPQGMQSATSGYFLGGKNGGTSSDSVDKLNFSNETNSLISAWFANGIWGGSAACSDTKGYLLGGFYNGSAAYVLHSLTFSNDTRVLLSSSFHQGYRGAGSEQYAGYYPGWLKLTFSNETMTAMSGMTGSNTGYSSGAMTVWNDPSNVVGKGFSFVVGHSQSQTTSFEASETAQGSANELSYYPVDQVTGAGFFASGTGGGVSIERYTFASDQMAVSSATLSASRVYASAMQTPSTAIFLGGEGQSRSADEMQYSTEVMLQLVAGLEAPFERSGTMSGPSAGYMVGGFGVTNYSLFKLNYYSKAISIPKNISSRLNGSGSIGSEAMGMLLHGGNAGGTIPTSSQIRFRYSDETTTSDGTSTFGTKYTPSTNGWHPTFSGGIIAGGISGATYYTDGRRIPLPTGTTTTTANALSVGRHSLAGTASAENVFFAGGEDSSLSTTATLDGVAYSTLTTVASSASLGTARSKLTSATAFDRNTLTRYLDETSDATETFDAESLQIQYAEEPLSATHQSDRDYISKGIGAFWQGQPTTSSFTDRVDRFNFNTLTMMSYGFSGYQGASSAGITLPSSGAFVGGYRVNGVLENTIIGFDFYTLAKNVHTDYLSEPVYASASLHSATKGYISGGCTNDNEIVATTTSISDLLQITTVVDATLATARIYPMGVSSQTAGYVCGGSTLPTSGAVNTINRVLFSTETASTLAATLPGARRTAAAFESSTEGYLCGGDDAASSFASIIKVTFSSETASTHSASLDISRNGTAGVSGSERGAVGGGYVDATTTTSDMETISFAEGSLINVSAVLTMARAYSAGASMARVTVTHQTNREETLSATAAHDASGPTPVAAESVGDAQTTHAGVMAYTAVITQQATPDGVQTSTVGISSAMQAATSSAHSQTAAGQLTSLRTEAGVATGAELASLAAASSLVDTAAGTDETYAASGQAVFSEDTLTSVDNATGSNITVTDSAEEAPAQDEGSQTLGTQATGDESAAGADAQQVTTDVVSDRVDVGVATDAVSAQADFTGQIAEPIASEDTTQAAQVTGAEHAAQATASVSYNFTYAPSVTVVEVTTPAESSIAIYTAVAHHNATATLNGLTDGGVDTTNSVSVFAQDGASANSLQYSVQVTTTQADSFAFAAAEVVAQRAQSAIGAEETQAADSSTHTMTFFMSGVETAEPFDLPSVSAVFTVTIDASALAHDEHEGGYDLTNYVFEYAIAAASAGRWSTERGAVEKFDLFVSTQGTQTVCYMRPVSATVVRTEVDVTVRDTAVEQITVVTGDAEVSVITQGPAGVSA